MDILFDDKDDKHLIPLLKDQDDEDRKVICLYIFVFISHFNFIKK